MGRSASGMPNLSELLKHPSVASRLRERWNRWEDILAEAIAVDVGARPGDPEPRVVAAALTGAIRVAAAAAQAQPRRRKEIAERVFDLLGSPLARYGRAASGAQKTRAGSVGRARAHLRRNRTASSA